MKMYVLVCLFVCCCCCCCYNNLFLQLSSLPPVATVIESINKSKLEMTVFDKVQIEPSDIRLIQYCIALNIRGQ